MGYLTLEMANRELNRVQDENDSLRRRLALIKSGLEMAEHYLKHGKQSEAWSAVRTVQQRFDYAFPEAVTPKDCEIFGVAAE